MHGYLDNIEAATVANTDYRRVVYTTPKSQLVFMRLKPGEEIGNEVHNGDQFIRVEAGTGTALLNNTDASPVSDGTAIVVPAGVWHNITNTGTEDLALYTLYSPPQHLRDTVQATKADEVEDEFDGRVSEEA